MKASEKRELKRELKHDKFVETIVSSGTTIQSQLAPYKRWVYGFVILLLIVGSVVISVDYYRDIQSQNAWVAIEKEHNKEEIGSGIADFSILSNTYANTDTHPWILYKWGLQSIEKANSASEPKEKLQIRKKAISTFERLQELYPKHELVDRGAVLAAQQCENIGNWKKASEFYRLIIHSTSLTVDSFLRHRAKFGLAYALEAQDQTTQAKDLYRDLARLETSYWGDNARYRLERLHASRK